jgi:hypothetical protein
MKKLALVTLLAGVTACGDVLDPGTPAAPEPPRADGVTEARGQPVAPLSDVAAGLTVLAARLEATYGQLGAAPLGAVWLAAPGAQEMGNTVFFRDVGNKQIPVQWVPGDPRRGGRTVLRYGVEASAPGGLSTDDVNGAADRAMTTWATQRCSERLEIERTEILIPAAEVDILHAGFTALPPGVLGLTIPFIWVMSDGMPTDIDNDGALDYAFAVILYSSEFPWAIDAPVIDLETVMLHEAGHGLGQAHFGSLFRTEANGFYHFAPMAVMNAGYTGMQQELKPTDRAGHCGIFGDWPIH